jgi:hypothetical protein
MHLSFLHDLYQEIPTTFIVSVEETITLGYECVHLCCMFNITQLRAAKLISEMQISIQLCLSLSNV